MAAPDLGRLIAVHPIDPAYLQRGIFITVLSFLFFLGTSLVLYYRGGLVYFILSTAFLIVYLISLFSIFRIRRAELRVYEFGFSFRGRSVSWSSVSAISPQGEIIIVDDKAIVLPRSLRNFDSVLADLRQLSRTS